MSRAWIFVLLAFAAGCGGSDPKPLPMNEYEVTITPDSEFNGETVTMETGVGILVGELAEQVGDHFDVRIDVYNDEVGTRGQFLTLRMFEQPLTASSTFQVGVNGEMGVEAFGTYNSRGPTTTDGQWETNSGTIVIEQVTKDYVRIRLEDVNVIPTVIDPEFGSAKFNGYIQLIRTDR